MKTRSIFTWACALAVAGVVTAQEPWPGHKVRPQGAPVATAPATGEWVARDRVVDRHNPVPVRIETSYYGEKIKPNPLYIDCSIFGEESCVRVVGGEPGAPAMLLCATEPGEIKMPWGVILVPPSCVVVPGHFDKYGCFEMPVNLGRKEYCGHTIYFQALELADKAEPRLSWGFKLRFARGNAQPAEVRYTKPAMQALLCKSVRKYLPTAYALLIRFEAAESYALAVEDVYREEGKNLVCVSMTSLGGPVGPNRWHRAVVDLGLLPEPEVEVWVTLNHGTPCLLNELAAVVETDF
jgi:hypothetical protein